MRHLIALVDGSIYSRSVCENAAWISERAGLAVKLLHVLGRRETSSAPANLSGSIALGARTALLKELSALDEQRAKLAQQRGRAILDDARALVEAAGATRVTARLRTGDLVETVAALEPEADLLVIGKRGEGADFAKLHLGSNLERVVRASHKPVYVAARAFRPVKRFLIAFDGGASSMKAVHHVAGSPFFQGMECRVLMVADPKGDAPRQLAHARLILEQAGLAVQAEVIPGQPEAVIATAVETARIDLLVMGAYGHSRIRSLIIGSTTTEMLRTCKIPLLLFR